MLIGTIGTIFCFLPPFEFRTSYVSRNWQLWNSLELDADQTKFDPFEVHMELHYDIQHSVRLVNPSFSDLFPILCIYRCIYVSYGIISSNHIAWSMLYCIPFSGAEFRLQKSSQGLLRRQNLIDSALPIAVSTCLEDATKAKLCFSNAEASGLPQALVRWIWCL